MKIREFLLIILLVLAGNLCAQNDDFNKESVYSLGMFEYSMGKYESALEHLESYIQHVNDKYNAQYANVLHKLGNIAYTYGDNQTALNYYENSLEIRQKIYPKGHPDCAASLINIGCAKQNMGKYTKSLEYLKQGAEMDKKFLGNKALYYGQDLHNLGNSYYYLRDFPNAEKNYLEALKIKAATAGEDSYDYATTLTVLANLYSDLGQYEISMKYYEKAADIIKLASGKENVYADVLNSIGALYSELGNYHKALEKYKEAKGIIDNLDIEKGIEHINIQNNMASAYFYLNNYDKALSTDWDLAETVKSTLGENTLEYARTMNNIGTIYKEKGEYATAIEYLQTASEIRKDLLGEDNIEYANSLNNIGNTLISQGNLEASTDTLVKAYRIAEAAYGKGHYKTIDFLVKLAGNYIVKKDFTTANTYLQKALTISREGIKTNFSFLSARERELYWRDNIGLYNTIIGNTFEIPTDTSAARCAYDAELITKGLLLTSEIEFNKLIAESKNSQLIAEFEEMKQICLILNGELEKPRSKRTFNCDSLRNEIQKRERHLVENCRQYGDFTHSIAINWKDVQKSLSANDVAIEFTNYSIGDSTLYAAVVLTKSMKAPVFVPLFDKSEIARLQRGVAPAKMPTPSKDEERGATSFSNKRLGIYESTGLYEILWKPLEKYFPEKPRIYFAPSGMIHQIGIEYVAIDQDQNMISDKYEIYRVSSTRFLAMDYMPQPLKKSVLYGGVYYDSDTTVMKQESKRFSTRGIDEIYTSFAAFNKNEERDNLNYLPGTKVEVETISTQLKKKKVKSTIYEGAQANEESFKSLSGQNIPLLHFATHGFFLESERKLIGDRSLVQSGLLLSGANYAWQNMTIPEGVEDGILTAKEISYMDLRNTDLVVLSACQTGLGEITDEGVFGLQRGFKKAGVRTIIMSLWSVDDNATQMMMTEFYTNLTNGMPKREAFLAAQKTVKTTPGFENPRYWAAFIMLDGNE